ncbi:unnamed protein product [Menidia menidia]|uniref:(Atlantic silverside) hypothetical protein n=1 Tax=Menidia menidia TaxID=238744 RepID=A0A8S4B0U4_9TELE|nr:unnamed protein product [Menidia menidia]
MGDPGVVRHSAGRWDCSASLRPPSSSAVRPEGSPSPSTALPTRVASGHRARPPLCIFVSPLCFLCGSREEEISGLPFGPLGEEPVGDRTLQRDTAPHWEDKELLTVG